MGATADFEKIRNLVPAGGPVFALKFADLQGAFIVDDVLNEAIVLPLPVPCLETYPLSRLTSVNIGRRIWHSLFWLQVEVR